MEKAATNILKIAKTLLAILIPAIISCSNSPDKGNPSGGKGNTRFMGYNLSVPDETVIMPPVLHEISGITLIDSTTIACIQDENGIIFIYDLQRKEITKQVPFHGNGDYEGIARVNNTIYVLKSNGELYEITNLGSPEPAGKITLKKLSDDDNEGLCYDEKNNRLLISHKNKPDKDSENKDLRGIYGYNLNTKEFIKKPVIDIELSKLNKFAAENKVLTKTDGKKKDGNSKPDIKFKPSDIAIHPLTGRLFVLSSDDHLLYVFSIDGGIEKMARLDRDIFNMPEGITFLRNGDMLISNEGQNRVPTLLRFNYKEE